jgi:hypothetical protein
MRFTF